MERNDSFIDSGKHSKIQLSAHKNVRGFDSEIDVSYLNNGKLVHKSYSDTGENLLGRNNNKDLSFLARIKCFVGLGTYEECHPEDKKRKHSSAPPCLTQQETLDLLEQKTKSLKSRIDNLEVVTEKLTATKKECPKKKKKKKCNPYIEFYSRICAKKPPKPCIQPVQLNPEETTQLRTVVTRSRSPTPCRRSRSPRQKPKRQKCKTSEQNLPEIKSSQTNSKMFCISSCPPRSSEYTPGSFTNMDNKFYRSRPNCDNYTLSCGKQASQTQFNTCTKPRNRSTSRKIQNNMSMQSPKGLQNQRSNGDFKECPCKKEKQKSESFQFQKPRSRPATASPCRSCNPVNLMHGIESDCIFAGLGASYNRSKSGDSAAKMLLAKYKHALPGDYGTQGSMSKCPSGDEKNSVMTSGNRTNSRRPDSPDQRNRQSQNSQNCISYASQPKKQKHHKKVELFSPCMKEIGPRSPVELFHALKRAEGWEKRKRSPTLKQSESAEKQQVPKPPFTMETLEQEILENKFAFKKSKKKGEKNKNASALPLELDSFDMVDICASNDSYYCPKSGRNHSVYFLKKCYSFVTHDLENISYHPELHEEYSFKQKNDIICLDCKCKNNNFGDENFRFFRQYLNITPGPSDAQSPSTAGQGDADLPPIDSETLINNVVDAYNVTETFVNNSQTQSQSELEHLENNISRMDNWILGEFPENISTKISKTTGITRKRSSGGVSNIGGNKKRSTTRVVNKKVPIKKSVVTRKNIEISKRPQTKKSEIIQNQKHQKFINSETSIVSPNNNTHSILLSPRKTSEVSFTSPERYLPQIVSESNMSEESIDFFSNIEKSPILKQEDKVVPQMETKRLAKSGAMESPRKINEKQGKSVKYSNRKLSPRTPVTRSEDNRYIPIERINEQISAQRELNNSPENSESGESSVDGEISISKIPEQSSGASFISRFTSFWKSKPSPDLACHVEKRTSDLILCGKESSVDLVDQDHSKESSVDLVSRDGSSNNGYFSNMEKTSLSEETSNFLRNIESIEPGECVGGRMFEFDHEFGKSTSFCIKDNDDFIQENISNNNGGNTEDENAEEEETKTDNEEAQKPVQTTPKNESSWSPSSTPQSAVTNPLLQQLFASSGVTWTKISPGDVDVANIRRAKEEFMKRQRAKKTAEVTPHPEAAGGCNDENLTLDLPVISRKKTIPIEVVNALAEESEQQIDTDPPDGALCKK